MSEEPSQTWPFISVVMNCYNGAQYLREAVESVLAQTYPHWELVFWDNQSTDDSAEIIHSYKDSRIQYYYAPTHTPLGPARGLAVDKAKGDWIGFLDCDDLWFPEKLEKQVALIREEKEQGREIGLVYGKALRFRKGDPDQEFPSRFGDQGMPEGDDVLWELLRENYVSSTNMMVSREAYDTVGGFPTHYKHSMDYYLSCAVGKFYRFRAVPEVISKYRLHDKSMSSRMWYIAILEGVWILEMYLHDYPAIQKRLFVMKSRLIQYTLKKRIERIPLAMHLWVVLRRIKQALRKLRTA